MTDAEMRAKEAKREYYRKYRATHREQIKEHNTRYWEKKWMQMELERNNAAVHENNSN